MYANDVKTTTSQLESATTQAEPLIHLHLCGCTVNAWTLARILRTHALTLRSFELSEVSVVHNEGDDSTDDPEAPIFQALASVIGLETLIILIKHDAPSRMRRPDLLVNALHSMPHLASVQFCRVFSLELDLNVAIDALTRVNKFIMHYEDACSVETLDLLITLVNESSSTLKSIEVAGCPNMFKSNEVNALLCDALLKCEDLEYVCFCENDLDDDTVKMMQSAFTTSKIHRVCITTSRRAEAHPVEQLNAFE